MAKKKSELDVGKGFKRIYFAIAGIWLLIPITVIAYGNAAELTLLDFAMFFGLPFVVYYILLFFIKGFKRPGNHAKQYMAGFKAAAKFKK